MESLNEHLHKIIQIKIQEMIWNDPIVKYMNLQNLEPEEYSYFIYHIKKDFYKQAEKYVENNEINVIFIYEDPYLLNNTVTFFNKYGGKIKYSLSPENQIIQTYLGNIFILNDKELAILYLYNLLFETDIYSVIKKLNYFNQ